MTDPRSLDPEVSALTDAPRPLRERLASYLALFSIGIASIVVAGATVAALAQAPMAAAVGYTAIGVGVVMVAGGGAMGGGYANLGIGDGVNRMASHSSRDFRMGERVSTTPDRRASKKYAVESEYGNETDLLGRLRLGLRPNRNPTAFWTVFAGFLFTAAGVALVLG